MVEYSIGRTIHNQFFIWYSNDHLNIKPFLNLTVLDRLNTDHVWYSDFHCIEVVSKQDSTENKPTKNDN